MPKWTKTIYTLFFLILVAQPHVIQGHILVFSSPYLQSLVTVAIFIIGYGIYLLHKKDIVRREKEKMELGREIASRQEQLIENYQYIGKVNRRLPLLQEITTDVLSRPKNTKNQRKEIFDELLGLATLSIGRAKTGLFRFVHTEKLSTIKEFTIGFGVKENNPRKISNKYILSLLNHKIVNVANGHHIFVSSEKDSLIRCVYIFQPTEVLEKEQTVLLQAIVDQAQLLYSHMYLQNNLK